MLKCQVTMDRQEIRSVIKFLHLDGKNTQEIYDKLSDICADKCPSYTAVCYWVRKFKTGHWCVGDEPREGRPASAVTERSVLKVKKIVLEKPSQETNIQTYLKN